MKAETSEGINPYLDQEGAHDQEIARLREYQWPPYVTSEILSGFDLTGKTLLDIGAGDSDALGKLMSSEDGYYIPLDARKTELAGVYTGSFVQASAEVLPFTDSSVEVVHERFAHQWLPVEQRKRAQQEALRVAGEAVVFMSWDWNALGGSKIADTLMELNTGLSKYIAFDQFHGSILEQEIIDANDAAGSKFKVVNKATFNRGDGLFADEVRKKIPVIRERMLPGVSDEGERIRLEALTQELSDLLESDEQMETFVTPDIVAVVCTEPSV